MAIEKRLGLADPVLDKEEFDEDEEFDVEVLGPDDEESEEIDEPQEAQHGENIAELLSDEELLDIAADLLEQFDKDKTSRKDWEEAYSKGLKNLGMKVEERNDPWPGACGVFHPLLTESVVRFQSHAIMEIFPAQGPSKTKIVGDATPDREKQAERVRQELNYQLTENMSEYRAETERMLFNLPLAGSAFKKVYYDVENERPTAIYVPAEDLVVADGAYDLKTCPRYTHIIRQTENEVRKLQVAGFYRDVDVEESDDEQSSVSREKSKIQGESRSRSGDDDRVTLLEMHVDYDLPGEFEDPDGIARPYVITLDKGTGDILSIYRNWEENDPKKKKRLHFTHYQYLPGMGFYGIGLIHLIGGLAKSATSILRQLVDAGTLSNLPAGFKARGMRVKGEDEPLGPGEWRDVDVAGAKISDSIMPLPYKEPSTVLYQLLGTVVDEGRRIGSIADADVGDMKQEAPVGTTLALMERSLKVMSAVQARLHATLRQELKLVSNIIRDDMPDQYDYEVRGASRAKDFDGRIDVLPVSDPNATTMAQKVVQYQAALEMAQSAPHVYNMAELHRGMLEVLQIKNAEKIVPQEDDMTPMDPVSENSAIIRQEPIKAFLYQDHDAHIQAHMAAAQDPKIAQTVGQSPNGEAIMAAMMAHINEHIAYKYRKEIEQQMGTELPNPDEPLPQEVEYQLSGLVAQAAQKLLEKDKQEFQQEEAKRQLEDPVLQLQIREMELKEREHEHNASMDREKVALEREKLRTNTQIQTAKISSEERQEGARLGVEIATSQQEVSSKEKQTAIQTGAKIADTISKERTAKAKPKGGSDG